MRFPKPPFQDLVDNYDKHPSSVHDCPRLYKKDTERDRASVSTCAIRLSEALLIANHLVKDRTEISLLDRGDHAKDPHLLAKYDYRNNLCPHGIARGAKDMAYFLKEHWGQPTKTWERPGKTAPREIHELTGVVAFIKLLDFPDLTGHVDVWNRDHALGHAYFHSEKVWLWKME